MGGNETSRAEPHRIELLWWKIAPLVGLYSVWMLWQSDTGLMFLLWGVLLIICVNDSRKLIQYYRG